MSYCTSALNSDDNLVLLARDADEVVGHLVARLRGPSSVHPIRVADLESIHVYAGHRNRGVGEQLMTAILSWAGKKSAHRASVTAYAANADAQRFYARHGFAVNSVILDRDALPAATDPVLQQPQA
jgi:GNAT superfamily N-acetyltransferase